MITTKNLRNLKNKSTLYIKYIDNENQASDCLYAIRKHSNRWQCGNALLSNKQICFLYNNIEATINNNWKNENFQYWCNK